MPVYTEPFSDEIMLNKLSSCKNVFLLGCPMCANISCNIYRGNQEPTMNILLKPLSMEKEIIRLKEVLRMNNFAIDYYLGRGISLCSFSDKKRKK